MFLPFVPFQEKGQRGGNRSSRKSKARQRVAEKFWGWYPLLRADQTQRDSDGVNHSFSCVNRLPGNARRTRGQLEELPGQREEAQRKEEQELPEAPQSEDGAAGMMLWNGTKINSSNTNPSSVHLHPGTLQGSFCQASHHHEDICHTADVLVPDPGKT